MIPSSVVQRVDVVTGGASRRLGLGRRHRRDQSGDQQDIPGLQGAASPTPTRPRCRAASIAANWPGAPASWAARATSCWPATGPSATIRSSAASSPMTGRAFGYNPAYCNAGRRIFRHLRPGRQLRQRRVGPAAAGLCLRHGRRHRHQRRPDQQQQCRYWPAPAWPPTGSRA